MPKPISDPQSRFWPKVEKTDTCWNWTAATNAYGYGTFGRGSRASGHVLAHRFSWELARGPIPAGLHIDHQCHNPACVRPSHLRVVNNKQNHENFKGAFSTSKTGIRGVSWDKRRQLYRATVTHNYKHVTVGRFATIQEAEEAVIAKRLELFTHNLLDR